MRTQCQYQCQTSNFLTAASSFIIEGIIIQLGRKQKGQWRTKVSVVCRYRRHDNKAELELTCSEELLALFMPGIQQKLLEASFKHIWAIRDLAKCFQRFQVSLFSWRSGSWLCPAVRVACAPEKAAMQEPLPAQTFPPLWSSACPCLCPVMDLTGTDCDTDLQANGYYVKKTEKNILSEDFFYFWNKGTVFQKGIREKQVSKEHMHLIKAKGQFREAV